MSYISAKKAAEKWGISRRRVQLLCGQGRIDGAFQIGRVWGFLKMPGSRRMKEL